MQADEERPRMTRTVAFLLASVPFAILCGVLFLSSFLRIGWLHLLMIGALPLGLSMSSAVAIATHVARPPWSWLLTGFYVVALLALWVYLSVTFRLNPFP